MAILRPAKRAPSSPPPQPEFDESMVPFVPAWELLQKEESLLSPEEAAVVAAALFALTPDPASDRESAWRTQARLDAVSRRM